MGTVGGQLQILRIVVPSTQDDQVLETPGDEQLAAVDEAEVPGAQERTVAIRQTGAERARRLLRPVPIARGHARTGDPDLPHPTGRGRDAGFRIDARDPLPAPWPPARGAGPARPGTAR